MPSIERSCHELALALKKNQSVTITKTGHWYVDGLFVRFVRWLLNLNESHLKKITEIFADYLDRFERAPLFFNADTTTYRRQLEKIKGHLKVAKALYKYFKVNISSKHPQQANILNRKVIALMYRVEGINGGRDRLNAAQVNSEQKKRLIIIAKKWKADQKILIGTNRLLHPLDLEKIDEVCRYPQFVEQLLVDKNLQQDFFSWTLKNCNDVQAFVEYPAVTERLKAVFLTGRIGRFAYENLLSIKKKTTHSGSNNSYTQKILRLPFEGKNENILDERKYVRLRSNYLITIKEIFEDMSLRNERPAKFEFFGKRGISNWRSDKMAYWNPQKRKWLMANLRSRRWWEALPPLETITKSKLTKRYNIADISHDQCLIAALAARQTTNSSIVNCHGYTEVLIPDGKGFWNLYPFGKFAKEWPNDCLDHIGMIADTTRADYIYPDPNIFYSGFRQQAALPFVVSKEEGHRYMNDYVRRNILEGRENNLVFMLGYENCAFSVQNDLESVLGKKSEGGRVPNLFLSDFFDCEFTGPLRSYFKLLKHGPRCIRTPLRRFTELILGTSRSIEIVDRAGRRIKKSLSLSPFNKGVRIESEGKTKTVYKHIFHPSHLHKQIIDNTITGGIIWAGNQLFQ